jgi:hypothetical protein
MRQKNSATIALSWERLTIPFKIEVDYVKDQLASFRRSYKQKKDLYGKAGNRRHNGALIEM